MAAHTPGPWRVESCDACPRYHIEAGAYPFGSHVCEVEEAPREGDAMANALILASAPDLLEALKLVRAYLDVVLGAPSWTGEDPYPVVDAAIAKAMGGA